MTGAILAGAALTFGCDVLVTVDGLVGLDSEPSPDVTRPQTGQSITMSGARLRSNDTVRDITSTSDSAIDEHTVVVNYRTPAAPDGSRHPFSDLLVFLRSPSELQTAYRSIDASGDVAGQFTAIADKPRSGLSIPWFMENLGSGVSKTWQIKFYTSSWSGLSSAYYGLAWIAQ